MGSAGARGAVTRQPERAITNWGTTGNWGGVKNLGGKVRYELNRNWGTQRVERNGTGNERQVTGRTVVKERNL